MGGCGERVMSEALTGHTIAWTISDDAIVRGKFTCHEPEGAKCREYCRGNYCEDGVLVCDDCKGYGHHPVEGRHCARCGTLIHPVPCIFVEWMEADSLDIDGYCGPTMPLRDGPVEPVWDMDHFDWRYVSEGEGEGKSDDAI